jgi:quercetin dioxygenase-like cupin family protein
VKEDEMSSHFQVHVSEVEPAPVEREDGWREMDIRFLIRDDNAGSNEICFWRTVFPPGGAHERHSHPNAAEVFYVLRGRGAAGSDDTEQEVTAGSVQYIPAGVVHWFRNLEPDQELELVGCYAPGGSLEAAGYEFAGEITDEYRQLK